MNLVKRNPDVWLPSVFDDVLKTDWLGGTTNVSKIGNNVPAVNIRETESDFFLEVAAPGKEKQDFKLELDNEVLTISSEEKKEIETTQTEGKITRREFSYSSFKRVFTLPESVDVEKISASYDKGILQITLPKKEEARVQPKRMIEIS